MFRVLIQCFIILSIASLHSVLFAQEGDIKKDTSELKEVVIIASRFPEKKEDVAQRIQIVKAARIQTLNAANTADVLQQTPGVLVQKSQLGGGSPIIRGFEANKILLVVDGVRMNNAIYRGGHLQNVLTLDPEALDRIEIGFGPSSVSYGSDALGGVMHVYTKSPQLNQMRASAFSRFASAANAISSGFAFNMGKSKWASLSNFSYSNFNDLRQGGRNYKSENWKSLYTVSRTGSQDVVNANPEPDIQRGSGYKQLDFLQKFIYRQDENISHLFNFQYSTSSNIPRYDRLAQLQNNQPRFAEWYYGPQNRLLASYQLQLKRSKGLFDLSNLTLAYQDIQESRHDRKLNNASLNNRLEQVGIISLNADFDKKFAEQEISYGIEFTHNNVRSEAFRLNVNTGVRSILDTRYPDGGSQLLTASVFLAHRWEMNEKWLLSSGLRLSRVDLRSEFIDKSFFPFPFSSVQQRNLAWSGNLGLIFKSGNKWHFALLNSTGFRAPNVDDLAKIFDSVPGSVIVPNPALKPEYTYNVELSVEKTFLNNSSFSLNGYYTWYRDAITTQPYLFNGQSQIIYNGELSNVTANVNANSAYLYGFSGGFMLPVAGKLWLKNEATFTFARITSTSPQQPLDHIPPFFGSSRLLYQNDKYEAEFFVQFNGAKKLKDYNPNGEDNLPQATPDGMPSWYTLNFRNGYRLSQKLKLQLALENILDQNYRVFASGISAPGRNFVISLRGSL